MRARIEIAGLAAALLIGFVFLGSFFNGLGGTGSVETAAADPAPQAMPEPPAERIRVEVLNGAGRSGIARAVTTRLRDAGYDVVYFGNASSPADSSVVLARTGDEAVARNVAQTLAIGIVRVQPDSTLQLEATVVLGKDWR